MFARGAFPSDSVFRNKARVRILQDELSPQNTTMGGPGYSPTVGERESGCSSLGEPERLGVRAYHNNYGYLQLISLYPPVGCAQMGRAGVIEPEKISRPFPVGRAFSPAKGFLKSCYCVEVLQ